MKGRVVGNSWNFWRIGWSMISYFRMQSRSIRIHEHNFFQSVIVLIQKCGHVTYWFLSCEGFFFYDFLINSKKNSSIWKLSRHPFLILTFLLVKVNIYTFLLSVVVQFWAKCCLKFFSFSFFFFFFFLLNIRSQKHFFFCGEKLTSIYNDPVNYRSRLMKVVLVSRF